MKERGRNDTICMWERSFVLLRLLCMREQVGVSDLVWMIDDDGSLAVPIFVVVSVSYGGAIALDNNNHRCAAFR